MQLNNKLIKFSLFLFASFKHVYINIINIYIFLVLH